MQALVAKVHKKFTEEQKRGANSMILRKKAERFVANLTWGLYLVAALVSFHAAWWLRFCSGVVSVREFQPYEYYIVPIMLVSVIWFFVFGMRHDHEPALSSPSANEIGSLAISAAIAIIITLGLSFFYRGYFYSRLVLILGAAFAAVFTAFVKLGAKVIVKKLVLKRVGVAKKLIIGCGEFAANVCEAIKNDPLEYAGVCGMVSLPNEKCVAEARYLGDVTELKQILIDAKIDEVILAHNNPDAETIRRIVYECRKEGAQFELVAPFWELMRGKIEMQVVGELSVIAFTDLALRKWQRSAKRIMDILGSGAIIVATAPLFVAVALAIKATSRGPVFFLQERVGRNGRKFNMVKFRSMFVDAEARLKEHLADNEASGPIFKMKQDPRVTSIGKLLRRFSIDELPQIFNVFSGAMSLVGPRPPLEREVVQYEHWQLKRIDVTPGMTGLWQVSGRSDLPFEKMVALDIHYVEHWSLLLDIKILFLTIPAVLTGRGAY